MSSAACVFLGPPATQPVIFRLSAGDLEQAQKITAGSRCTRAAWKNDVGERLQKEVPLLCVAKMNLNWCTGENTEGEKTD